MRKEIKDGKLLEVSPARDAEIAAEEAAELTKRHPKRRPTMGELLNALLKNGAITQAQIDAEIQS